ncbi:MAG: hypothetical protein O3A10_02675 [Chloroflexi bacterium]|nr:hypothetical protein [Chloroflexota bacterium]MDA1145190.1 hypothetical protein [Chloroflexota bacterium]
MRVSPRTLPGLSLAVIGLLAAACSTSSGAATATPNADGSATAVATGGPDASPTSTLPDWVQTRLDGGDLDGNGIDDALQRYVANTGGGGVSHRTACEPEARLDAVWPEGTALEVVPTSGDDCADWTLVTDGEVTSWVLDKYLSDAKPAPVTGGGGGGGNSGGGAPGWVQVINYQSWLVPVSKLRIAEVGETWCDAPSWHDPVGGDYVVETIDGTPFVNPDPQRCGFGKVSEVAVSWVAAP